MYSVNDLYGYNDYDYLNAIIDKTLNKLNIDNVIFSIIFISDEEMQKLNKEYRNIDQTTDVLSFAFEDNAKIKYNEVRLLGDIYISIPKMKDQALEYHHSEEWELSFLVVHGILHLLGYDHMEKEEEKIMFAIQEAILNE